MLWRKIESTVVEHLQSNTDKILILEGARQVGKSFIIREVGRRMFTNFHEINFILDDERDQIFKNVSSIDDFYFLLSSLYGNELGDFNDTLIFLDEIQHYPKYLTWLKFLRQDRRYRFIASGSLLGIALRHTTSIPIGSIALREMYPLDFEEFMIANGVGHDAIGEMQKAYEQEKSLPQSLHTRVMDLFRRYLLVGGMPDAVNAYLDTRNIIKVREVQAEIHTLYQDDASKYEEDANKRLLIKRIYDMVPSQMENKKKRIVARDIQDRKGDRFDQYREEFEYLLDSGITLGVNAITNPRYPLSESLKKNLIKLYLNDVGILSGLLYHNNIRPVLDTQCSVNLGAVYENVVAQELKAHGFALYYYDQRKIGEVDFLIDDYSLLCTLPIEVKSGKDYTQHSALYRLLGVKDYGIHRAIVFSNDGKVRHDGEILYMPIYYVMFLNSDATDPANIYF
ncbi:MAG: AAA family ATPase [Bacteroidales bacterium]|nr:AAA family ATPase [Bacteroidales bacterium]